VNNKAATNAFLTKAIVKIFFREKTGNANGTAVMGAAHSSETWQETLQKRKNGGKGNRIRLDSGSKFFYSYSRGERRSHLPPTSKIHHTAPRGTKNLRRKKLHTVMFPPKGPNNPSLHPISSAVISIFARNQTEVHKSRSGLNIIKERLFLYQFP